MIVTFHSFVISYHLQFLCKVTYFGLLLSYSSPFRSNRNVIREFWFYASFQSWIISFVTVIVFLFLVINTKLLWYGNTCCIDQIICSRVVLILIHQNFISHIFVQFPAIILFKFANNATIVLLLYCLNSV